MSKALWTAILWVGLVCSITSIVICLIEVGSTLGQVKAISECKA